MAHWHERVKRKPLTPRQVEVMELVCLGKTNGDIGAILGISERTAKNHVTACREKLVAGNKVLLVAKYLAPERFEQEHEPAIGREPVIIAAKRGTVG